MEIIKNTKIYWWLKTLRPHQWSKNLLLFLSLTMSHRFAEISLLKYTIISFISFSLVASAVYIVNDLLDLESDRKHPDKKNRPFAANQISTKAGIITVPILIVVSFGISIIFLPKIFTAILFTYLFITTAYSLYLKKIFLLDVLLLGGLYTLRIVAGGIGSGVEVSTWLLIYSWFFFLSLAFMKRYTDLISIKGKSQQVLYRRGYSVSSVGFVQKMGVLSGILSLLILIFYINSAQATLLYKYYILLYLAIPILLYWLLRMWYFAHNGKMMEDPIIFALKDKVSYFAIIFTIVIFVIATG